MGWKWAVTEVFWNQFQECSCTYSEHTVPLLIQWNQVGQPCSGNPSASTTESVNSSFIIPLLPLLMVVSQGGQHPPYLTFSSHKAHILRMMWHSSFPFSIWLPRIILPILKQHGPSSPAPGFPFCSHLGLCPAHSSDKKVGTNKRRMKWALSLAVRHSEVSAKVLRALTVSLDFGCLTWLNFQVGSFHGKARWVLAALTQHCP